MTFCTAHCEYMHQAPEHAAPWAKSSLNERTKYGLDCFTRGSCIVFKFVLLNAASLCRFTIAHCVNDRVHGKMTAVDDVSQLVYLVLTLF